MKTGPVPRYPLTRLRPRSYLLFPWSEYPRILRAVKVFKQEHLAWEIQLRPRYDFNPVQVEIRRVA